MNEWFGLFQSFLMVVCNFLIGYHAFRIGYHTASSDTSYRLRMMFDTSPKPNPFLSERDNLEIILKHFLEGLEGEFGVPVGFWKSHRKYFMCFCNTSEGQRIGEEDKPVSVFRRFRQPQ